MLCQQVRLKPGVFEARRSERCVDTHSQRTGHFTWRSLFWVVAQRRYVCHWCFQTSQGLRIQEEYRKANGSVNRSLHVQRRTCLPVLSLHALTLEDRTDTLSRNVGNKAICAAQQRRAAKLLSGYISIFHNLRYITTSGVYNCCRRRQINCSLSSFYWVSRSTPQSTLYRVQQSKRKTTTIKIHLYTPELTTNLSKSFHNNVKKKKSNERKIVAIPDEWRHVLESES